MTSWEGIDCKLIKHGLSDDRPFSRFQKIMLFWFLIDLLLVVLIVRELVRTMGFS